MRFLIREQEYEVPLAGGRFVYPATGAVEAWRLTAAEDFRVLRVDLDERETERATSTLFHLLFAANWQPERLSYRSFGAQDVYRGTVIAQGGRFLHSVDERDGEPAADVEEVDFGLTEETPRLWFPTALGRSLATAGMALPAGGLTANSAALLPAGDGGGYTLAWQAYRLRPLESDAITVGRTPLDARRVAVSFPSGQWTIWLDDWHLPLRLALGEEVVAAETQVIRYADNMKRHPALEMED